MQMQYSTLLITLAGWLMAHGLAQDICPQDPQEVKEGPNGWDNDTNTKNPTLTEDATETAKQIAEDVDGCGGQLKPQPTADDGATGRPKRQTSQWCHMWRHASNMYALSLSPTPSFYNPNDILLGSGAPFLTLSQNTELKISVPNVWSTHAASVHRICWYSRFLHAVTIRIQNCGCNTIYARSHVMVTPLLWRWHCINFPTVVNDAKEISLLFHTWFGFGWFQIDHMYAIAQCDYC